MPALIFSCESAFATNKGMVIEFLQTWRQETQTRTDLDSREKDLRLQFETQLIFQTDRKYNGRPLKDFFSRIISDLIETEQNSIAERNEKLLTFMQGLRTSLKDTLEPQEDVLRFIQGYVEYSGLTEPASADEFASDRNYYNGKTMRAANPLDLEAAATLADEMIRKSESQNLALGIWVDFQQDLVKEYTLQEGAQLSTKDLMLQNSLNP